MWIILPFAFVVADARANEVAKTPTTFTVDSNLSIGAIENFREVYVDPGSIAATLSPVAAGTDDNAVLEIPNDFMSWTEVTINGTKIGIIGAMKDGRIQGIRAGAYDVTLAYPNGHTLTARMATDGFTVPAGTPKATAAPDATPAASATVSPAPQSGETKKKVEASSK